MLSTWFQHYQQIHVRLSSTCMTKMYPSVPSLSSLIVTIAVLSLLLHVTIRPYLTYRSSKSKIWGLPERVGDLAQSAARDSIGNANMWCFCSLCIDAHNCMCPSRYEPPHLSCREFICKNVWNYISIWFDFYIYNYAALIALISIMRLNLVPQFCFNV